MDAELRALIDKSKILEILYTWCRAIDRADPELLRSVYHSDAREEHGIFSGPASDFVGFIIPHIEAMGPTQHSLSNHLIDVRGDIALSESYVTAFHADIPDEDGNLTDLVVGARYVDRFERRRGEWRIAHRQCVIDWNQNLPASGRWVGPMHGQMRPRGVRGGEDYSYQNGSALIGTKESQ